MRGNVVEEALREIEALQVIEAVQQPVGVSGIAARLELPELDEPGHAGVDRFVEQMLQCAPKPGRNPLGDAGFDPAFGRRPARRRTAARWSSWPAGSFVSAGRHRRTCVPGPSFDRASGASSRSRSLSSRAARPEKDRNPYSRRNSAR